MQLVGNLLFCCAKSEVLDLESNLLFLGAKSQVPDLVANLLFPGEGGSTTCNWKVINYANSEVLDLESNLSGGGWVIYYMKLEVLESTKQEDINGISC